MSNNRDGASFFATTSPPYSNALYEDYGLTHKQWCDYKYPEEPLNVINAQLEAVTRELRPARINAPRSSHFFHPGRTNLSQSAPDHLSPPPRPSTPLGQANYDDSDDSGDSIDLGSSRPVSAQIQAPVPAPSRIRLSTAAKRPAEDAALIGTGIEEKPDPIRADTMASLTKEVRTATLPRGVPHRKQLDLLRDMPLRRQLSLRKPHRDFYRSRPDYWDATAGYLVGEVVPEPCSYCKAGSGLFAECVVVPPQSGSDRQPLGGVCMSCAYQSSGGKCSFHPNHSQWKERTDRERKEREANA
ncbi:uncharacterized protein Bfra_012424 [Botrytis fragariae]|uniref:Uncharacterized protein n=1 Tax=Botrytis fragariae TaxID=1964551 RepID=A0A8H6AJE7_9HELO|nr:uncharacterized protein Bfra_012424 [Botrytis fragariae]KAF5868512.1 hypothetical protein Bfra_012424 [Botrytis fragariae]